MTQLERRIVDAVAGAMREGLQPKSVYLTLKDYRQLRQYNVGGLPVRAIKGGGASRIYCKFGVARAVRKRAA